MGLLRAFARQALNRGRFIPTSPIPSQCVLFLGDFGGWEGGSSHPVPPCTSVLGCSGIRCVHCGGRGASVVVVPALKTYNRAR